MAHLETASEAVRVRGTSTLTRACALLGLAAIELPFLAFLYDPVTINSSDEAWLQARVVLREIVPLSVFFLAAFCIIAIPRRLAIIAHWKEAAKDHQWRSPFAANIVSFAALSFLTLQFNEHGANFGEGPPWALFAMWTLGVGGVYLLLAAALAPVSFWRQFLFRERFTLALAFGAASMVETAAVLSRQSWSALSEATFHTSAFILSLYESNIRIEADARVLGANDFAVNIAPACSGYEGIGLVTTFLAIYLWIFRSSLKFPNVYLILPIGIAAIWILNSVRIAALISLGAHVSPEIAVTGFHSQAGWMMFLLVTIGIMAATHQISFFHNQTTSQAKATPSPAFQEAKALMAPFLAMTAAGIIAAAFTAESFWLYGLRVFALVTALYFCRHYYQRLNWRAGWEPVLLGLAVGVAWIATDPGRHETSELGLWLASLGPAALVIWLTMRVVGTVLLVPIAEELAFRGYIHRKLIADNFEKVPEAAFAWKAFIASTILFGVIHERWLAGALAGAVFAIALYRSGKISGAIIAHMAANAIIALWAIVFSQWSLL